MSLRRKTRSMSGPISVLLISLHLRGSFPPSGISYIVIIIVVVVVFVLFYLLHCTFSAVRSISGTDIVSG